MARIMAIDYGTKKIGFAVTDPLQLSVNGLETQSQETYWDFINTYLQKEEVETVVIGHPLHADGTPTQLHSHIIGLKRKIEKNYPGVEVVLHPEALTSKRAREVIYKAGIKKKKRRDKTRIDKVSAMLILQDYLGHLE